LADLYTILRGKARDILILKRITDFSTTVIKKNGLAIGNQIKKNRSCSLEMWST
jgi:hypothetical protein